MNPSVGIIEVALMDFALKFLVVYPFAGFIPSVLGVFLAQSTKDNLGARTLVEMDRYTYQNRLMWVYGFMTCCYIAAVAATYFGFLVGELSVFRQTLYLTLPTLATAWVANYAAKRLRNMGYSRYPALLVCVPLLGPAFAVLLAFTTKTRKRADS